MTFHDSHRARLEDPRNPSMATGKKVEKHSGGGGARVMR
jgi:hypothetical protein